ncbi:hypothetical protein B0O80DRAFT_494203 [Mortierella sp. GBAus27b]|nr:hypothetical protein BGX31_005588 [Mortierella sp. GBA43]KAI8361670.1 hypothetical protein B0O80DRAFT_494203 [Mortierella sp. GBAus27b]
MRVTTQVPRSTLLALFVVPTLLTSPQLASTADARAIDIAERPLPHTPFADSKQPSTGSLQIEGRWKQSGSFEIETSTESSSSNGIHFSIENDIEDEEPVADEDSWEYSFDEDADSDTVEHQTDINDNDDYSIAIEPQFHTQDLFGDDEDEDEDAEDDDEENKSNVGLRRGGIDMISRFRQDIEMAFEEVNEEEDKDNEDSVLDREVDGNDIDDEGDYVGFWYGDRRFSQSSRRRQGLGLTLRGTTGGKNHGRESWVINDRDWEENLDRVLSLEDVIDRVEDLEHGHSSASKHGVASAFHRLFPLKKWPF